MDDIDRLVDAMRDRRVSVRKAAVRALGEMGGLRAVHPLINALNGPEQVVREAATEALSMIGKPSVTSLIKALGDDRWVVRRAAAEALGEIADSKAVVPLMDLLKDESADVREVAAKALGEIHLHLPPIDKEKASTILCSECLCRFEEYQAKLGFVKRLSFFLCPGCYGSSFIDNVPKVVAILDHSFDKPYTRNDTTLLVNWFSHKEPFDFDEIRIKDASDFDVDELVMRVKNDMDDKRRKRYKSMPVFLSPQVELSKAQTHMLKDTFGRVEIIE